MTSHSISISKSESLIAALCALLTLNIYTLSCLFISIHPFLHRSAALYVLCLQGLVSLGVIRLFYIATRAPFQLYCRKTLVLMLLCAVFPTPRVAVWVLDTLVMGICVRRGWGFCKGRNRFMLTTATSTTVRSALLHCELELELETGARYVWSGLTVYWAMARA